MRLANGRARRDDDTKLYVLLMSAGGMVGLGCELFGIEGGIVYL